MDAIRGSAREAQRAIVEAEVTGGQFLWVEACPGAGKTRVVVDRHLERPLATPRQGRAIVSFTRMAGRELRRRCDDAGSPELVSSPHFIGTLDSFIWLHLVRPYLAASEWGNRSWRRLDSWHDHPKARQRGLSLDDFVFTKKDGLRLGPAKLRNGKSNAGTGDPNRDARWAQRTHRKLFREGFFTGELLRDIALKLLSDQKRARLILDILVARFSELIVDEAQDCSDEDRRILQRLNEHGLPVLLVGDPDQAIYGFRDPSGSRGQPVVPVTAETMRLRHNWRSTQNICDAAATLRTSGHPADVAAGEHHGEDAPIMLVPMENREEAGHVRSFAAEAQRLGIPQAQRIVASNIGSALPAELTGSSRPPRTLLGRMVWAVGVLRAPGAPRKRLERAHRIVWENLLNLWCGEPGVTVEQRLERFGLTKDGLLRAEARVIDELPSLNESAEKWNTEAKRILRKHQPGSALDRPQGKLGWRIQSKDRRKHAYVIGGLSDPTITASAEVAHLSTIHQVKGEEWDAVLVIVPPAEVSTPDPITRAVESWLSQRPLTEEATEARNVLYVAATRARQLLAFALDADRIGRARAVLESHGVSCRIVHQHRADVDY
ncbi:UvrD-helicase domain-containing protein [Halostreptopolyspora alba]|uniref:UvrD-helicase domain-containing protein n=1 Tax=Halostreptopolyspora alba TaxID=2487137 RepID=UPI003716F3DD